VPPPPFLRNAAGHREAQTAECAPQETQVFIYYHDFLTDIVFVSGIGISGLWRVRPVVEDCSNVVMTQVQS
jgi:hypothetical protein